MKLRNIDWELVCMNAALVMLIPLVTWFLIVAFTQPKPGPTIEEQLQVIQANQQTMTEFLVQNHNRLNKRVDLLEQRQDGMLPLPTKEEL